MPHSTQTTLKLYKQNLKFSSAHFLIFDEKRAEKLHGHNYQVQVEVMVPSDQDSQKNGFFIDFNILKKEIKRAVDLWDEHVLLPAKHPEMRIEKKAQSLEVHFRERFYVFPENEVILLPITNTSVEQLSQLLAKSLIQEFRKFSVQEIRVSVEESLGQASTCLVKSSGPS